MSIVRKVLTGFAFRRLSGMARPKVKTSRPGKLLHGSKLRLRRSQSAN
jgi:hypothetical protein